MHAIKNLGNIALLVALIAVIIVATGAYARLVKYLFCLGYGC